MYLIDVLKHTCINFKYFSSINMHLQMKFNKSITFLEGDWGKKKIKGHSWRKCFEIKCELLVIFLFKFKINSDIDIFVCRLEKWKVYKGYMYLTYSIIIMCRRKLKKNKISDIP